VETESYTIKTSAFEGPLGLLLELIEKRKLFINDLSLATVTEDYLNYMNKLGGLSPAHISSFVFVASTLILIKSKSLLPNLALTAEEEGDIKNLEERLRLYEIFSRLSNHVKSSFGKRVIFPLEERKNEVLVFLPDERITRENIDFPVTRRRIQTTKQNQKLLTPVSTLNSKYRRITISLKEVPQHRLRRDFMIGRHT
jgi:chromatin segregation and condensation protein Rec8/ScpA/Scc1 (kleisin family)